MKLNLPHVAEILNGMGYKAKYVAGKNQTTEKPYSLVEIQTGRRVDATLKESGGKITFETWGRFPEGHNGMSDDELKRFNRKQAAMVRAKLEAPVLAAVAQELAGGTFDLKDVDAIFGTNSRQITEPRAEQEADQDEPEARAPLAPARSARGMSA